MGEQVAFFIPKAERVDTVSGVIATLEPDVTRNGKRVVNVEFVGGEKMVFPWPSIKGEEGGWDYPFRIDVGMAVTASWTMGAFGIALLDEDTGEVAETEGVF